MVGLGVTIPSCLIIGVVSVWWYRMSQKQAKHDREWIVNSRHLNFQRHKKNEFGDDTAENFVEENTANHGYHDQDGKGSMMRIDLRSLLKKKYMVYSGTFHGGDPWAHQWDIL